MSTSPIVRTGFKRIAMDTDGLEFLASKLKCGEYDGMDIMSARIAIEELIQIRKIMDENSIDILGLVDAKSSANQIDTLNQ